MAVSAAITRPMDAQHVLGPWEDATIAPRGVLRAGVAPRFATWRERFDDHGTRGPLGAAFTLDSLGAAQVPFVAGLQAPLATLTGLASPALSLGTLATSLEVTEVTTAVSLDYGLTSRVGLSMVVPYVKNHVYVTANPNAGTPAATIGVNPASLFPGARSTNESVFGSLGSAATALTSELARCAGSMDPTCSAVNADRPGAQALVQLAGLVSTALAQVYGTATVSGNAFAPVAGSAIHAAVDARLADLNTRFRAFLGAPVSGEWVNGRPVAAPPMGAADLASVLGDAAFGIAARPFADFEHSHVGDVEIGAKVVLLDTFGPASTAPPRRAGALRIALAGLYRLPTGQLDLPGHFADLGAGQKQPDLEARAFADLAVGPRLWTSAIVRFALQQPDRLVRRITEPGSPFPELARELEVERNLGDVLEAEVAPRFVPNDEFSFSAMYRYRRKGEDAYSGRFDVTSADGTALSLDAAAMNAGTDATEQMFGFAVTYSTIRGHAKRLARLPVEVSYSHTIVLSGQNVPRVQANAIGVRIYR